MVRGYVGRSVLGCTIIGLLVGATSIVGMSLFADHAQGTAQVERFGSSATIPVEWRFSEPQPDWRPALPVSNQVKLERTADALRVGLSESSRLSPRLLAGDVYIDLRDWRREEWADVVVLARTAGSVNNMRLGLNPPEVGVVIPANAPPAIAAFLATF